MITTSGPQLQIRLLGGVAARTAAGKAIEVRSRGSALLLARLAHPVGQVHRREALIDALFPDDLPETGRTRLRQCLYLLRQELEPLGLDGELWLRAERETIRLEPGAVTTDVAEINAHQERARRAGSAAERAEHLTAAMAIYGGEFLPGHFDDWVLAQRERLNEQHASAMCDLSTALVAMGDLPAALESARQAVSLDRLREESHRVLMRALAASGRAADAERQCRELERLLKEELGVSPSAATRHLREEIQNGQIAAPPAPNPPVTEPPPQAETPAEALAAAVKRRASERVRLPQPVTRFYGRAEEIARIERWLAGDARPGAAPAPLVTLTGPGGAGKTRLALEIAHRLDGWFGSAVWFVSLEAVTDSMGFLVALSQALGLAGAVEASTEQVAERLRRHPTSLLVLDNFEHLVNVAALEVQELRSMAPGLACLVSSRQRLGLRGEQEVAVSPLPVPRDETHALGEAGNAGAAGRMLAFPSVQLFVDRAQAARASFKLTPENAAQIAAVCQRLDGLPLALELGAAWLAVLSPQQALDRLSQGMALLVSRNQDLPERHRSLQAALDSSYLLLSPEHRCLFRRLSVFRDGWTLEAAEAVCRDLVGPGDALLEALALLAERSLVQVEDRAGTVRYRLLETMRHYTVALAAEAGEAEAASAAHAQYYHSLALEHCAGFRRAGKEGGLDVVEVDLENARAALTWLSGRETTHQEALQLAGALGSFCWMRGRCAEGRALVERALDACSAEATSARLSAYNSAAWLARVLGHDAKALEHLLNARSIAAAIGDLQAVFSVASSIAGVLLDRRDLHAAEEWIRECEAANRNLQDPRFSLLTAFHAGTLADLAGRAQEARDLLERSVALATEHRHPRHLADALGALGWTYREEDPSRGTRLLREGLKIHREIGHSPMVLDFLLSIGALELASGQAAAAARSLREALRVGAEMHQQGYLAAALTGIAATEAADERWERAALLFGAAESLERSLGGLSTDLHDRLALTTIAARRSHCAAQHSAAWREGSALALEDAMRLAHDVQDANSSTTARVTGSS